MPIVALLTSAAVPPDALTYTAWSALHAAPLIVAADPVDPVAIAVREAGFGTAAPAEAPGVDLPQRLARRGDDLIWLAPHGSVEASGLATVTGSTAPAGGALVRMATIMQRLRRQCPWDAEQTHDSLATYLLEEAYEVLEALDERDGDALRDELGDLLLQVYFHAEIAAESGAWTIDDVAQGLIDKLVRRHPHVFADVDVRHADDVEANWDRLKAAEKSRDSVLDGVPSALPALAYADKVTNRLRRSGALQSVTSLEPRSAASAESKLGQELLALVLAARDEGIDAEQSLRRATRELARRAER